MKSQGESYSEVWSDDDDEGLDIAEGQALYSQEAVDEMVRVARDAAWAEARRAFKKARERLIEKTARETRALLLGENNE